MQGGTMAEYAPPKLVITSPWRALCVDLIGPYTLKSKDRTSIDFMYLTKKTSNKYVQNSENITC
jgi:hypothetical protein